jgi:P27 family predicted phage terminase small subunit
MGERGPLPKSDNVLQMRGTKDRKRPSRPKAVPAIPARAAWLEKEAKAEWDRITPELERMGLLAQLDRAVLHAYCETWAKWVAVSKSVTADVSEDPKHPGRGGVRKSPLWSVYLSLSKDLIAHARELGLTPAARGRMTVPEKEEGSDDGILD